MRAPQSRLCLRSVLDGDPIDGDHHTMRNTLYFHNHKSVRLFTAIRHLDYPAAKQLVTMQFENDG